MKTSVNARIKFSDKNSRSELKFGSIIDMIQDCMNHQSESIGLGVAHQLATKKAWIISSWYIEIDGQFDFEEEVTVSTWPYEFKGVCGRRNAVIVRTAQPQIPVIKVDSLWAVYDVENEKLTRVPKEDIRLYTCEERLEMRPVKGKIVKGIRYEEKDFFIVRKYQLDFNNHMNNGWYIKLAEEFIDNNTLIKHIRAEYKKAARYKDILLPFVSYEEKRIVVELRSEKEEIYAIIEFGLQ